jgi:hypothetical protein
MPGFLLGFANLPVGGGGGSGADLWVEDEFTAIAGQTLFTLSFIPADTDTLTITINGIVYDDVSDFTITGNQITWLNTVFALELGDKVLVRYMKP